MSWPALTAEGDWHGGAHVLFPWFHWRLGLGGGECVEGVSTGTFPRAHDTAADAEGKIRLRGQDVDSSYICASNRIPLASTFVSLQMLRKHPPQRVKVGFAQIWTGPLDVWNGSENWIGSVEKTRPCQSPRTGFDWSSRRNISLAWQRRITRL